MIFPQGCKPDRIPWFRFNDKLSRQSFREKRRTVIPDQTQGRNCIDHAEYMQEKMPYTFRRKLKEVALCGMIFRPMHTPA